MRRLAVLTCRSAGQVCTGASCLKALRERTGAFAAYAGVETQLAAFFSCGGCGGNAEHVPSSPCASPGPRGDAGMGEKLDRLEREGVDIVHLGVCTKNAAGEECPHITALAAELARRGLAVVRGTH